MATTLGNWAVIDIETSGINAEDDSIIDVGFLQFEELKLTRKYESLVQFPMTTLHHNNYGHFIQKLTGITPQMLQKAPHWDTVVCEVQTLADHHLIAHNSDFEKSFINPWLDMKYRGASDEEDLTTYEDSLYYLGLLHPEKSSLKLEEFINDYGIRDHEKHRGFEDALDLLKVMLLATSRIKKDLVKSRLIMELIQKYHLENWWFAAFFNQSTEELEKIATQIDFSLDDYCYSPSHQLSEDTTETGPQNSLSEMDLEFSGKNITNILKNEKLIQESIPPYKFRQGQLDLSKRVGQALKNKTHALIQAPTGTGKTLGYLLPAALFCLEDDSPILIATGTKALQTQAMTKDIPQLRKILGEAGSDLKISHLVGSNNHLCELLFRHDAEENSLFQSVSSFEEKFTYLYYELVFHYNGLNLEDSPLLREDIPYVLRKKLPTMGDKNKQWAVDYRSCSGRSCPYKNECTYVNGIREAKEADIIVGNHALMFAWPKSIIRPANIIIDEAHKIEHETTSACTVEIDQKEFENIHQSLKNMQGVGALFYLLAQNEKSPGESTDKITLIRKEITSYAEMLHDHLEPLAGLFEKYFKKMPRYTSIYWNELPFHLGRLKNDSLGKNILNHLESVQHIFENIVNYLLPYASLWDSKDLKEEQAITAWTRFESFFTHLSDCETALSKILSEDEAEDTIQWTRSMKYHEEQGFVLTSAPVNVGKMIHDHILQSTESVVFTSATLGNAHGDQGTKGVEWASGYLYLEKEKRFQRGLYLPAIFDYQKNTRVYLCDDVPALYDNKFVPKVLKETMKVSENLGGRSLFLFSARARFEVAREILLEKFEGTIPVFIQGMGNNVVEDFKKSTNGILLGMESFGEGIDIPGESLQFIFIDKIPDLRMDLVINDRRDFFERNIGNEFTDYYLSHRTRALHQKLGRLIRTDNDHGGIIVVDSRIKRWKGKTIEKVFKLMEPYQIIRTPLEDACKEVVEFIQSPELTSTTKSTNENSPVALL